MHENQYIYTLDSTSTHDLIPLNVFAFNTHIHADANTRTNFYLKL